MLTHFTTANRVKLVIILCVLFFKFILSKIKNPVEKPKTYKNYKPIKPTGKHYVKRVVISRLHDGTT